MGPHLFAYNYPRAYPLTSRGAAAAAGMLNQFKVTDMPYRHPWTTPFATVVQIRRAEEGSPGGFTVGGGAGTIEWAGGVGDPLLRRPPSGGGWGEGGSRPPPSCPKQNTPHGASASISPAAPCIFPRPVAIILGEIRSCEILVEGGHVNSATADLISVGGLSPIYSAPRAKLPAAVQT